MRRGQLFYSWGRRNSIIWTRWKSENVVAVLCVYQVKVVVICGWSEQSEWAMYTLTCRQRFGRNELQKNGGNNIDSSNGSIGGSNSNLLGFSNMSNSNMSNSALSAASNASLLSVHSGHSHSAHSAMSTHSAPGALSAAMQNMNSNSNNSRSCRSLGAGGSNVCRGTWFLLCSLFDGGVEVVWFLRLLVL